MGRLQRGKLALDLAVCRSHRFHARLVLRREGMERGLAKLRVHVIGRKLDQQRFRRQVQYRRVGVRRTGKAGQVEREQSAAFDLDGMSGLPLAEDGVETIDGSPGEAGIERFGDPVGKSGNAERMRRHRAVPRGMDASFNGDGIAPRADQEQFRRGEILADRIEHPLAEGAGKSLLGTEQHQCRSSRSARRG